MRKDVRTGAAIGGILIAVIVVYAIVVSKTHSNNKKDKVALDRGTSSSAGEPAGGPDRSGAGDAVTGAHEEHPDTVVSLNHEPQNGIGATPTPSHTDNGTGPIPAPGSEFDAVAEQHGKRWNDLIEGAQTLARASEPEHLITADPVPTGDNMPRGVISTVDRTQSDSPAPTGDTVPGEVTTSAPERHIPVALPVVAAPASQIHRIASGETFSSIARATYGDSKYFKEIIKANPKVDPTHLRPGMVIVLPDKPQEKHEAASPAAPAAPAETRHRAPAAAAAPASIDSSTEYRVKSSDSLYKISMKLYNTPNKVDAIYQLNKEQIGADPARLKLNMVLKLPEAPTATSSH